jgi:electron transfer flavoprotein alpha subunit
MGAELAASGPICDNGRLPMDRQVGSSGQTVAPKLNLAVGISGAIQYLAGMKGAKIVIAINKDGMRRSSRFRTIAWWGTCLRSCRR